MRLLLAVVTIVIALVVPRVFGDPEVVTPIVVDSETLVSNSNETVPPATPVEAKAKAKKSKWQYGDASKYKHLPKKATDKKKNGLTLSSKDKSDRKKLSMNANDHAKKIEHRLAARDNELNGSKKKPGGANPRDLTQGIMGNVFGGFKK
uniref:Small acidic protein-like domain-containing protein n=1 Tax=Spongospora subterranea TaxID=70186 RepID=A0A0H5RRC6_9EUKA|eukprot:CRZ11269.1 hypothetical protein [Spongospora subterranea]